MSLIHSTSFPEGVPQQEHSRAHQHLRQAIEVEQSVVLRPFHNSDTQKIKDLNRQWFPIAYGQRFYQKLKQGLAKCWVAECKIISKSKREKQLIVGAVIYEYTEADGAVLQKQSWTQYLSNPFGALYIMTLGVIDEFRKKGVATLLLQKVVSEAAGSPLVRYINLHVVSYNSAYRFYQKNSFQRMAQLHNYYHINGREYDAYYYVMFINGGKRREGWLSWIKSLLSG